MSRQRIQRDDYTPKVDKKPRAVRVRTAKRSKKSPVVVNVVIQQDLQQPTKLKIAATANVDLLGLFLSFFGC